MKEISTLIEKACRNLNIDSLNGMQKQMLETAQRPHDIILLSPTGTGKTLAFLLPVLQRIDPRAAGVQALVLVPSRELALQIESVLRKIAAGIKIVCCYGGHSVREESKSLAVAPALIVGTPGRIADHLRRGRLSLDTLDTLVLDEFDKCLALGFHDEMKEIIAPLKEVKKKILTSATDSESLPAFTALRRPVKLDFLGSKRSEENINERLSLYRIDSPEKDKLDTLLVLLRNLKPALTLIFCNQRESVDRVQQFLTNQGIIAEAFHGGMEQADRERALCKFRNCSSYICVSTDLAARGLDIPEVKYIIHYHLPVDLESFTHRNGRTARMHAEGEAFMIVDLTEQLPEYARQATAFRLDPTSNLLQTPPMATLHFAAGKKEKISKGDIVGFLTQKGGLTADEIGFIEVKDHYCYAAVARDKAHETLRRLRDEKIKGKKVKISFSY
ncbi:helicase [Barnesiella viscericola DSM 18177]|uniref:Helicase n=1 Tax=Barnesiella viscericola DSM 18177 TaxID=880074 RepID=W0ER28_9BACT|nr:DEAD/DEAH box helicase [Barnesiella viscericola]AHF13250.1 helicase [Barnesiella viscericola DSM 18177]